MIKKCLVFGLLSLVLLNVSAAEQLTDGGVQAVLEAQADGIQPQQQVDAEEIVTAYQDKKNFYTKIGEYKIFSIGTGSVIINGEIASSDAFLKRDMAATIAMINARIEIMTTISTEMTAEQRREIPGTPSEPEVPEEVVKGIAAFEENAKELFAARQKDDLIQQIEDKTLTGQKLIDVIDQVVTDDPEALAANKALRTDYLNAQKTKEGLKKELESTTSVIKRLSKMPIFGCTVIAQAETVKTLAPNRHELTVAVLMVWSKKLQEGAAAILKGESVTFPPDKKGREIYDWLKEQDRSTIIGGRQFIDKDGKMWFLGASSRMLSGSTTQQEKNKIAAKMTASSNAVFSLFSEAGVADSARQTLTKYEDMNQMETNEATEEVARSFQQNYKDLRISGLTSLKSGSHVHPLLNQKAYVAIYGINTADAKTLRDIRDNFYKTAKEVNTAQERERGKEAELKKQYEASKDNPTARAEGAAEAKGIMADKKDDAVNVPNGGQGGKIKAGATAIPDNGDEPTF